MPDDQYIRLQLNGIDVTLIRNFLLPEPPRTSDELIEVARASTGTFYVSRRWTEDWHKFEFEVLCTNDVIPYIQALYYEHEYLVRTKSQNPLPDILLTDCTTPYTERSPRSRAIASAPFSNISVVNSTPEIINYFAKYYVYFAEEPKYTRLDEKIRLSLRFKENNRKVPLTLDG